MTDEGEMEVHERQEIQGGEGTREGTYFQPPVDIYENGETITVVADLPGCDPDDIDINLENNRLTLVGTRDTPQEQWDSVYEEYPQGHFMREFRLGKTIDRSGISANFRNGVLKVTLPKTTESRTKKIEVETA